MFRYRDYGRLWRVYGRSVVRYGSRRKLVNAMRTEWAYRRRKVDVPSRPYVLFVEPLYYCNLACPLCDRELFPDVRKGRGTGPDAAGQLPLETFERVMEEIGDDLFQCHIFGVGEPMLNWPLTRRIIEAAHRRRVFTLVSTNATLLTEKVAEEVVASGLDHLACAIDGVTQEAYGKYRIGGRVEEALAGMRRVAEARDRSGSRIIVEWQYLVNRYNVGELDAARRLADDIGVYLRFAPIGGVGDDIALQDRWLPAANDPVGRQWRGGAVEQGGTLFDWPCYWLWRGVVLNSNGQLGRCPGFQTVAQLGGVAEAGVMAIYNGPVSQRARQLFSKTSVPDGDFPMPCDRCDFYHRHHGGTPLHKPRIVEVMRSACDRPSGASKAVAIPTPFVPMTIGGCPDLPHRPAAGEAVGTSATHAPYASAEPAHAAP